MKRHDNVITCRFSSSEIEILDNCIDRGLFRNRSDAVRALVWKAMEIYNLRRIEEYDYP